ncbi:MAG: phospholipase A [Gallionellaceae bacterium]|jgi:phospholipase A1
MSAPLQKWLSTTRDCGKFCTAKSGLGVFAFGSLIAIFCMAGMPSQAYAAKAKPNKAVKSAPIRTAKAAPARARVAQSSSARGLAHEWEPGNELKTYKKNYLLLYAYSSHPNNLPTSPNPLGQVLTPYALDNRDMKFQISLKHDIADFQEYGSLWLAYTQLVLWQYYNRSNSQPIREIYYEPEFIYSLRPSDFSLLNLGFVHQSNGEPNPRSRSWNRVYIQPGLEIGDEGWRLVLLARWWQRLRESALVDDNADIVNFLGYREFELRYIEDENWEISVISRIHSTQLDIAAPWSSWLALDEAYEHNINVHLHYFNGFGESLLDYNQSHVTWGVGVSFPFDN